MTRISLFTLQFPKPAKVFTLPFTLRSQAWYYSSNIQPSQYSFLGITDRWNLVAFGDSVNLTREDTSAKELTTDPTTKKPTLLQDIFGSSAFVDLTNAASPGSSQRQALPPSTSIEDIFETPAYLTPAISTFFDSLVDTVLRKRVAEAEPPPLDPTEMDVDEDDEMECDQPQITIVAPGRTVTSSEMNDLVRLFRKHAIQG
jgi:NET1-associated nuclear protein 1 (U3 small nucleolar RNA-associated protein 17)